MAAIVCMFEVGGRACHFWAMQHMDAYPLLVGESIALHRSHPGIKILRRSRHVAKDFGVPWGGVTEHTHGCCWGPMLCCLPALVSWLFFSQYAILGLILCYLFACSCLGTTSRCSAGERVPTAHAPLHGPPAGPPGHRKLIVRTAAGVHLHQVSLMPLK